MEEAVELKQEHLVKNLICKTYLSETTGNIELLQLRIVDSLPPSFVPVKLSTQINRVLEVGRKVKFVGRESEGLIGKIVSVEDGEAGNKYSVEDITTSIVDIYYADNLVNAEPTLLPDRYCIATENVYYKIHNKGKKYRWIKSDPRNGYNKGETIVLKVDDEAVVFNKKEVTYVSSYYKIINFLNEESNEKLDNMLSQINSIKQEFNINRNLISSKITRLQEDISNLKNEERNDRQKTTKLCNGLLYSLVKTD